MFSKAIDLDRHKSKLDGYPKLQAICWWVEGLYHKAIGRHIYFLMKVYAYAKVLRNDFDFDAHSLYPLLHLKLTRIEVSLKTGYAVHEKDELQALRICIKLLNRLNNDDHYHRHFERHEAKWGELKSEWPPADIDKNGKVLNYLWVTSRPNANTPELIKQEREESRARWMLAEQVKQRDKKIVFTLISKYLERWWD